MKAKSLLMKYRQKVITQVLYFFLISLLFWNREKKKKIKLLLTITLQDSDDNQWSFIINYQTRAYHVSKIQRTFQTKLLIT